MESWGHSTAVLLLRADCDFIVAHCGCGNVVIGKPYRRVKRDIHGG